MGLSAWLQAASQTVAAALIASLWQGILLAAMMAICLKLAPKTGAGVRFFLWMAVFVAIALSPFATLLDTARNGAKAVAASYSAARTAATIQMDSRWAWAIAGLWLAVSSIRAVGLLRNGLKLRAIKNSSAPIAPNNEMGQMLVMSGFRAAQLCSSPDVDQPCVVGFFAPRILIPEWLLAKATTAELEQIVLHEAAHLRRRDDWTNLLQKLALVVFPLNPGLWWAEKRLCSEREAACDESVVSATHAPTEYATCLANLAEERMRRRAVSLSLGAWERQSELGGRIKSILSRDKKLSPMKARVVMAALSLATATGAMELGQSSQPIAFTTAPETQPAMQAQEVLPSQARYQDVVYREPAKRTIANSVAASQNADFAATDKAELKPVPQKRMPSVNHVGYRDIRRQSQPQAWMVVTEWGDSYGRRMTTVTVIDRSGPSTANAAAELQSRWYFIQL